MSAMIRMGPVIVYIDYSDDHMKRSTKSDTIKFGNRGVALSATPGIR
jgi:hypothetical protein